MNTRFKKKLSVLMIVALLILTGAPIIYYATDVTNIVSQEEILTDSQILDDTHLYSLEFIINDPAGINTITVNGESYPVDEANSITYINASSLDLEVSLNSGYDINEIGEYILTDMGEIYSQGDITSTPLEDGYVYDFVITSLGETILNYGDSNYQIYSGNNQLSIIAKPGDVLSFGDTSLITDAYTIQQGLAEIDPEAQVPISEDVEIPTTSDDISQTPIAAYDSSDGVVEINKDASLSTDSNANGKVDRGDIIDYNISLDATRATGSVYNVVVTDSILGDLDNYPWLSLIDLPSVTYADGSAAAYQGSLLDNTFVLSEMDNAYKSQVTISYSLVVNSQVPTLADNKLKNIVTIDDERIIPSSCTSSDLEDLACGDATLDVVPTSVVDTTIKKSVIDQTRDGKVEGGEMLSYSITVSNPTTTNAKNVLVRDSLTEAIDEGSAPYVTFDEESVFVNPVFIETSGNLSDGTYTINEIPAESSVTITYGLTVLDPIDSSLASLVNNATDNGTDPAGSASCLPGEQADCSGIEMDVVPETLIDKSVVDQNGDNVAQPGETLTYNVSINNPSPVDALDVLVRDSLVESIASGDIDYALFDETSLTVSPPETVISGSLLDGTFKIDNVPSGQTVDLSFKVKVTGDSVDNIVNNVTDDGSSPNKLDLLGACQPDVQLDCSKASIPLVAPNTIIEKSVIDATGDGQAQPNETLTYTIKVTNTSIVDAYNVIIRDGLVESIVNEDIDYMKFDESSVTIKPDTTSVSGELSDGTYTLLKVPAGDSISISFTVIMDENLKGKKEVVNNASDDGKDPDNINLLGSCSAGVQDNCSGVVTPIIYPDTVIEKHVADENHDASVQPGETLTYTIDISNNTTLDAQNVVVRDSLVEAILNGDVDYASFDRTSVNVTPRDTIVDGRLPRGNFTIDTVPAGSTISISYTIKLLDDSVTSVINSVSDNGENPEDLTCAIGEQDDCSQISIPVFIPNTTITNSVSDMTGDGYAEAGEKLTYTLKLQNTTEIDALYVPVRSGIVEQIEHGDVDYATFAVDSVTTTPETATTGSLLDGDYTLGVVPASESVEISFDITMLDPLEDVIDVVNNATDNGENPDTYASNGICDSDVQADCSGVVLQVIYPDTTIEKSVVDATGDGNAEQGETLTYTLKVSNPTTVNAKNVVVRDGLVEQIEHGDVDYATFAEDSVTTTPETATSGSLLSGDYTLGVVPAGESVEISFDITMLDPLEDVIDVVNNATDNGENPDTYASNGICDSDVQADCSGVVLQVIYPDTTIEKSVVDATGDGNAEQGETLTYTLKVSNPTTVNAKNVVVRDGLVEQIEHGDVDYATFAEDSVTTTPETATTGSLLDGDYTLGVVPAGESVEISFDITMLDPLEDVIDVVNNATDNGENPDTYTSNGICDFDVQADCSGVVLQVIYPDTTIEKSVVDATGDGNAEQGETLTYTLKVSNPTTVNAKNVVVRDGLVEQIEHGDVDYATFAEDSVTTTPETATSGSLLNGDYTLGIVPAGESVEISFDITMLDPLEDVIDVVNNATDNGENPEVLASTGACSSNIQEDCSTVILPISNDVTLNNPNTIIKKFIIDEQEYYTIGDTIKYKIEIINDSNENSLNVVVRDSLFENMPSYLKFNDDLQVSGSNFTGNLMDGNFVLSEVPANEVVTMSYSFTIIDEVNNDEILNIATDNGSMPEDKNPSDDSASAIAKVGNNVIINIPTDNDSISGNQTSSDDSVYPTIEVDDDDETEIPPEVDVNESADEEVLTTGDEVRFIMIILLVILIIMVLIRRRFNKKV